MNIKANRAASFVAVTMVYILASALGIALFVTLPFVMPIKLLVADAAATVLTFIFSLIFKNSSVYDPYWSVQPIVILLPMLISSEISLAKILVFSAVAVWAVRLTANWAYTFKSLMHQDWRYTMLKEKTGGMYPVINFLGIHMFPTVVVYLATLPAVFVMESSAEMTPLAALALILSIFAVLLQGAADVQMQKFRRGGTGGFIRDGLWKYSRHPNYLGEILMWWGIALSAVALLGFKWYYILGACVNTVMFLVVSIPMADGRQSKKPGFYIYKSETRMLLPIRRFK